MAWSNRMLFLLWGLGLLNDLAPDALWHSKNPPDFRFTYIYFLIASSFLSQPLSFNFFGSSILIINSPLTFSGFLHNFFISLFSYFYVKGFSFKFTSVFNLFLWFKYSNFHLFFILCLSDECFYRFVLVSPFIQFSMIYFLNTFILYFSFYFYILIEKILFISFCKNASFVLFLIFLQFLQKIWYFLLFFLLLFFSIFNSIILKILSSIFF